MIQKSQKIKAALLILENYDHAVARGANIYCEILGYGTNSDGVHVTQPSQATMQRCIMLALEEAQISKSEIGYVSAHGTATPWGDIAERHATLMALDAVPISSMKSYGVMSSVRGDIQKRGTKQSLVYVWGIGRKPS